MGSSENFCLTWNDFNQNMNNFLSETRQALDIADVTLVCGDKKEFEAHRMVLSAASSFFKGLLRNIKHVHPVIYLKGLEAKTIMAMLDFVYNGAVNIPEEDFNEFFAMAK